MPDPLLLEYLTSSHWRLVALHYDRTLQGRAITCPLCAHTDARERYQRHDAVCQFHGGRLERYACPICDVVFGPMKMLVLTPDQLALEYRALYSYYQEVDSIDYETRAFRALEPRQGGVYLNWGCGAWASTIDALRAQGHVVWGYEPFASTESPYVVNQRGELSASFDGIFSNNLLEHLRDPVGELRAMTEHLQPGGRLSHATACFDLLYLDTRFHLFFFLGRSVELLAERAGLQIVGRERDGEYINVVFERAG